MLEDFSEKVQSIAGPVLSDLGFTLEGINDAVDEGGRQGRVAYYRGQDCKLQIYWSAREFEINAMIAPLSAPNEHGLYDTSSKWHYLNDFINEPELPLEDLVQKLKADRVNFESSDKWLKWLSGRILEYFPAAHAGIIDMYRTS